ncbi:hypothetical protein EON66_12170, partial [archaeon]
MQVTGRAKYVCTREGDITEEHDALLPAGVNPQRVSFLQGDACDLPPLSTLGGPFSVIHGANLLCRLPDPRSVRRCRSRVCMLACAHSVTTLLHALVHPLARMRTPAASCWIACPVCLCRAVLSSSFRPIRGSRSTRQRTSGWVRSS